MMIDQEKLTDSNQHGRQVECYFSKKNLKSQNHSKYEILRTELRNLYYYRIMNGYYPRSMVEGGYNSTFLLTHSSEEHRCDAMIVELAILVGLILVSP